MSLLKLTLLLTILDQLLFSMHLDTDCFKEAGSSIAECKQFTTFQNETGSVIIEENVHYLCCYRDDANYKGCIPIKEDEVFANEDIVKSCFSNFLILKKVYSIFFILIIFF